MTLFIQLCRLCFVDCLGEDTNGYSPSEFESLIEFAVGGLCNLALGKLH